MSLGWVFTELDALKGNDLFTFGKLRLSYAQVGQAGSYYENFYYTPSYSSGMYAYSPVTYPIKGVSAYVPYYVLYDPDLKPQNTENIEGGFDLRMFNDRVRLEYTVSYQNVTDQIFSVPTAGSTGYQYLMTNAGKMRTWSHEIGLNIAVLQHRDYDLNLGVNFTAVDNKVVELAEGVESIMLGGFVEPQVRAQAGNTYPNIYGYAFKRDEATGKLLLSEGLPHGHFRQPGPRQLLARLCNGLQPRRPLQESFTLNHMELAAGRKDVSRNQHDAQLLRCHQGVNPLPRRHNGCRRHR